MSKLQPQLKLGYLAEFSHSLCVGGWSLDILYTKFHQLQLVDCSSPAYKRRRLERFFESHQLPETVRKLREDPNCRWGYFPEGARVFRVGSA